MEKRKRNDPSPTKKRTKINTLDAFLGLKPPKPKEVVEECKVADNDTGSGVKIAEIFLSKAEKKKRKQEKNLGKTNLTYVHHRRNVTTRIRTKKD
jgi:hypothetical protein